MMRSGEKPGAPRIRRGLGLPLISILVGVALTGCPKKPDPKPDPTSAEGGATSASHGDGGGAATPSSTGADAAHGKELVATYQCNRCHDGTGHAAAPQNKHCVHCHKDIMEDRFTASAASMARWKPRVKELADAPSLEGSGKRFSRRWIEDYLLQPSDLRPHLKQYMPRLAITPADARDIAAYLVPEDAPAATSRKVAAPEIANADLGNGRKLLDTKGCGGCHVMTGVVPITNSAPPAMDGKDFERSRKLAPDLRVTRDRTDGARLVAWLKDPKAVKPDSAMPKIDLTDTEIRDLAGYILASPLTDAPAKARAERLPVLTRKVTYKEVDEKVFHRTCWHCHSEPDYAIGDGGPGNSGGFGFKPRGLNLSGYEGIAAGFVDDKNERQSVFAKEKDGTPRLVKALLARYDEEAGASTGVVRGMPLGYDPVSLEDIQLVDTWIAQGRPK